MATVVRMPAVLAGATEAAIARWLVAPGDVVAVGTPVAEIETEKALVEYAAEEAGIVGRLVLAEGEAGQIGDPILVLVAAGEADGAIDAALGAAAPPRGVDTSPPDPPPSAVPAATPGSPGGPARALHSSPDRSKLHSLPLAPPHVAPASLASGRPPVPRTGEAGAPSRIFASPLVRKIAGQKGIDLAAIEGTGPNGRIVRRDLERLAAARAPQIPAASAVPAHSVAPAAAAMPAGSAVPAVATVPAADGPGQLARDVRQQAPGTAPAGPAGGRLVPHSAMRRAIARRLSESKASIPHFYMATECVVDEMLALRERVNAGSAARVSVNDFVLMAAAGAFGEVPEANVTWADEGLIAHDNVDISIAVATDGGLVTPVLRDIGAKRLSQVAREARDLAQRARMRRLLQRELEGGVLSVSNLGMHGTLEFSAIINPPQSAILAVGAARQQPVVADGVLSVATVMRCTLSVDHRAIDGALAARWLAAFTARMQDPLAAIA